MAVVSMVLRRPVTGSGSPLVGAAGPSAAKRGQAANLLATVGLGRHCGGGWALSRGGYATGLRGRGPAWKAGVGEETGDVSQNQKQEDAIALADSARSVVEEEASRLQLLLEAEKSRVGGLLRALERERGQLVRHEQELDASIQRLRRARAPEAAGPGGEWSAGHVVVGDSKGVLQMWRVEDWGCDWVAPAEQEMPEFWEDEYRPAGGWDPDPAVMSRQMADCGLPVGGPDGHSNLISGLTDAGGGRLVSSSFDGSLRVWRIADGVQEREIRHEDYHAAVTCVAYVGGGRVASGGNSNDVRVWRVEDGACICALKGHTGTVWCVAYAGEGRVVSGSDDKSLRLWRVEGFNGSCERRLEGHKGRVNDVAYLGGGGLVVSASDDKTLRVWSVEDGTCLRVLEGHTGSVTCVADVGEGRVVSGSADGTLRVWRVEDGTCEQLLKGSMASKVKSVAYLGAGRLVSTSERYPEESLRVWDLRSGGDGSRAACELEGPASIFRPSRVAAIGAPGGPGLGGR